MSSLLELAVCVGSAQRSVLQGSGQKSYVSVVLRLWLHTQRFDEVSHEPEARRKAQMYGKAPGTRPSKFSWRIVLIRFASLVIARSSHLGV